jgi:hypothetical protein
MAEAAEVGAVVPPVDVQTFGNTAGYVPQPDPAVPDDCTLCKVGEIGIGITEGEVAFVYNVGKFAVLNALTFGGYGTFETKILNHPLMQAELCRQRSDLEMLASIQWSEQEVRCLEKVWREPEVSNLGLR